MTNVPNHSLITLFRFPNFIYLYSEWCCFQEITSILFWEINAFVLLFAERKTRKELFEMSHFLVLLLLIMRTLISFLITILKIVSAATQRCIECQTLGWFLAVNNIFFITVNFQGLPHECSTSPSTHSLTTKCSFFSA